MRVIVVLSWVMHLYSISLLLITAITSSKFLQSFSTAFSCIFKRSKSHRRSGYSGTKLGNPDAS